MTPGQKDTVKDTRVWGDGLMGKILLCKHKDQISDYFSIT